MSEQPERGSEGAIRAIAEEGGRLGIEIVDVAGLVDEVSARVTSQSQEFHALRVEAREVLAHGKAIGEAAAAAHAAARTMEQEAAAARTRVAAALADIRSLVELVQGTAARLEELRGSLENVASTAGSIEGIAVHTNILAINASVEAVHAGARGAGFALIAEEVRNLSHQTREASRKVDASLKGLAAIAGQLAEASQVGKEKAVAVGAGAESISALADLVGRATREIEGRTDRIGREAGDVEKRVTGFIGAVQELDGGVAASSASLAVVNERLNGLMLLAERILGLSIETGVDTVDRTYVDLAVALAGRAGEAFEAAIAAGQVRLADLFDERYVEIPRSDPRQYTTRFTALADRLLPPVQEPPLERDPHIVFVVAVDRNGYLPTHNRKFSLPQRSDLAWNQAHSRNRRIFDDRVGLAAARNEDAHLVQCYRRDMGSGQFALMKDASAPIVVSGRHWGALRVGYRT
jgi:methyl-accepting chemotaxis protein